jgi:hypothetical protein
MRRAQQLERHYYDPGVNPQPKNPRPKAKAPYEKKRPYLAADSARLRKAELKRMRKRARNLNALLLPGPRWVVVDDD